LRQIFVHQLHHQGGLAASVVAAISLSRRCCGLQHDFSSRQRVEAQMHPISAFVPAMLRSSDEKRGAIDLLRSNYASKNKKNVRPDTVIFDF
jgi:hypothetical protein